MNGVGDGFLGDAEHVLPPAAKTLRVGEDLLVLGVRNDTALNSRHLRSPSDSTDVSEAQA